MKTWFESVALVQSVSPLARELMLASARPLKARQSDILVERDSALSDVFLLVEGILRIYALNPEGKEAALYRLRAGEICLLSLNTAFAGGRYPANVKVESASAIILRIPGEVVRSLFEKEPAVRSLVLHSLTSTIDELLARLDEALLSSLGDRLYSHLARSADARGRVATTHQSLADNLGVTRESVSREIVRLKKTRKIITGRGVILLKQEEPA